MHTDFSRPIPVLIQANDLQARMVHARLAGVLLLLFMLVSVSAQAQYMGSFGVPYSNPVSAAVSNSTWSNWIVYQTQQKKAHGSAATSSSASAPSGNASAGRQQAPAPRINESALKFHPTGTRLLAPKLVDELGKTQAQKDQVNAILTALFQEFDKQAVKMGKPNDLAFALSYFLGQNATLYRGKPDPRDEQFLELRETIVLAMGQNEAFAKMTDRKKQEMHEMLVSYTGLVYLTYQDAKKRGDLETAKTMRELAGLNLKAITHIEPERIDFTVDEGLTIKKQ